jgi:hypothetical protein
MRSDTTSLLLQQQQTGLDEDDNVRLFQDLIDTGMAWRLEGAIGREAMSLIDAGQCTLGDEGHRDYYGNYVPSKHEVEPGTKGSPEFVAARRG